MNPAEIIGALMTPEGRVDPYPLYAQAHKLGPASFIEGGWLLVPGYDAINQVLRNSSFGVADSAVRDAWDPTVNEHSAVDSIGNSLLNTNPPKHGRMRSLISSVFTPRRVAALEPAIGAAVDKLLDSLEEQAKGGEAVDFMEEFAFRLPVTVICELLGVPEADRYRFRPLAHDLTAVLEIMTDVSTLGDADRATDQLHEYFAALAAERRADPREDLVSALVQARDAEAGGISDKELLGNLTLLLIAGFETTTNLLGNGLALLFEHPGAAEGLRGGEIPVAGFVDEVLRFDSPVQLTTRIGFADDLVVGGVPIARGTESILLIGAANRDPERFPDPDRFDPLRPDNSPLSFGAGAHFCLGSVLARLEATTVFPRLLDRFPALAPAADRKPTRRDRLVLRGYETLPITVG